MSREMSFLMDGRLISIERFEDETDAMFAERSSFILAFRNDPQRYELAKILSFHHAQKMFRGVTYKEAIETPLKDLRDRMISIRDIPV